MKNADNICGFKVDQPQLGATVLEEQLQADDFEVMPDGTIKLYNYLDDIRTVSRT